MHPSQNFFEHLRDQIVISDVVRQKINLTKRGQEYLGLCPFHSEKSPSFTVNDIKRFYHCFGCGAHGDVVKFIVETCGFSYMEAAKKLATDYGIPIPKPSSAQAKIYEESEKILTALNLATQFFTDHMTGPASSYLKARKLDQPTIDKYNIGFAPSGPALQQFLESKNIPIITMHQAGLVGKNDDGDTYPIFRNRIIFPIKNIYSKVIAFGGRILGEGMPKYLNSPESLLFKKSETLYGEDIATGAAYQKKRVIVVEGYLDVIAMHNAGFLETVATLGTAVTESHLAKLWRIADEVIFCLDGDQAGQRAMQKAIMLVMPLLTGQRKASFLILPEGLDPDEIIDKFGPKFLTDMMAQRIPTSEMIWHLETNGKKLITPESKAQLEGRLEEYIKITSNTNLARHMRSEFKNKIWNLGKSKKATKAIQTMHFLPDITTNIELVEYNLFTIILKYPDLLKDEEIYNKFMYFNFKNQPLNELRLMIIDLYDNNPEFSLETLEANAQKSGFFDLFVLLSSGKAAFLDTLSLDNFKIDHRLLWKFFVKKHELELLREEYARVISSQHDDRFDKASAYLKQINKAEIDVRELSEILTS